MALTKEGKPIRVVGLAAVALLTVLESAAGSGVAAPSVAEVKRAKMQLEDLRSGLASVEVRLAGAKSTLDNISSRVTHTRAQVRSIAKQMIEERKAIIEVAREMYMGGGSASSVAVILSAKSVSEFSRAVKYLQSTEQARSEEFERFAADEVALEQRLNDLDDARAQADRVLRKVMRIHRRLQQQVVAQEQKVQAARTAFIRARHEAAARRAELARQQAQELQEAAQAIADPEPGPPGSGVDWDAIAECESGGDWHLDGLYDGGLQFHPDTWLAYGGGKYARYAWQATREEQIDIAENVLEGQGPSAWPNCFQYG